MLRLVAALLGRAPESTEVGPLLGRRRFFVPHGGLVPLQLVPYEWRQYPDQSLSNPWVFRRLASCACLLSSRQAKLRVPGRTVNSSPLSWLHNLQTTIPFQHPTAPLSRPGCWAYPDMLEVNGVDLLALNTANSEIRANLTL